MATILDTSRLLGHALGIQASEIRERGTRLRSVGLLPNEGTPRRPYHLKAADLVRLFISVMGDGRLADADIAPRRLFDAKIPTEVGQDALSFGQYLTDAIEKDVEGNKFMSAPIVEVWVWAGGAKGALLLKSDIRDLTDPGRGFIYEPTGDAPPTLRPAVPFTRIASAGREIIEILVTLAADTRREQDARNRKARTAATVPADLEVQGAVLSTDRRSTHSVGRLRGQNQSPGAANTIPLKAVSRI